MMVAIWLTAAEDDFRIDAVGMDPRRPFLLCPPIGATVPQSVVRQLERSIGRCVEQGTGPLAGCGKTRDLIARGATLC